METGARQKVASLKLELAYPDGATAEFAGEELYADITLQLPDWPALLEVQDVLPYAVARPDVDKLTIEVTLTRDGRMRMATRPAPGAGRAGG